MIQSLAYPFSERLVILDRGQPEGKYAERHGADLERLQAHLNQLKKDRIIDEIIEVPWDDAEISRISTKYFGTSDMRLRDPDGAPIYQYLFGLNACSSDFFFHADSDMLFFTGRPPHWIDQGTQVLDSQPEVVFVSCGSPPQARNPVERLTRVQLHRRTKRWGVWQNVSTRFFLTSREKFEEALIPLIPAAAGEPLERTLTHTCRNRGLQHWSLHPKFGWAIHPLSHNQTFLQHLDGLIHLVLHGEYPFVRHGERYNLSTKDQHFQPWRRLLQRKGLTP